MDSITFMFPENGGRGLMQLEVMKLTAANTDR
jgi:hypothetical protein